MFWQLFVKASRRIRHQLMGIKIVKSLLDLSLRFTLFK